MMCYKVITRLNTLYSPFQIVQRFKLFCVAQNTSLAQLLIYLVSTHHKIMHCRNISVNCYNRANLRTNSPNVWLDHFILFDIDALVADLSNYMNILAPCSFSCWFTH